MTTGPASSTSIPGVFLGIKHAMPAIENAGRSSIINVSSIAATAGSDGPFAYTTAGGDVRSMTKHLAYHYDRFNTRVNSIHLGGVKSPMIEVDLANHDEFAKMIMGSIPLGRLAEPSKFPTWPCSWPRTSQAI